MRVAVIGAGPAGATCAERLARAGARVTLLDEKLAWEKPCGGGITAKAWKRYPYLIENAHPKQSLQNVEMVSGGRSASFTLGDPLLIYSRLTLNALLIERAAAAGARVEKDRVLETTRTPSGWLLRTRTASLDADFCILANGARNSFRHLGAEFHPRDSMVAMGYRLPGESSAVYLEFFPQLSGYLWVFPRCGHLSIGICGKGMVSTEARRLLERWMDERGYRWREGEFYAHLIPSLEPESFAPLRLAGDRWLACGDAAGLVDPVTGEGIYYAIRSGDLACRALVRKENYRNLLESDFLADLSIGARFAHRFYKGKVLGAPVTDRMVQLARRSRNIRAILRDLFAGEQGYQGLRARVMNVWRPILTQS
jgi:geranylgeranyl reductase family protein